MFFVTVGVLFVGGVLGAASLIIAKKPDAKELIDKLTPYQGWIGVVLFLWGVWDTISVVRYIGLLSVWPIWWIIMAVGSLTELLLGFLLGFGLITKYALSKNEAAMQKGQEIRAKLAKFQGPLGLLAIVLAIVYLVFRFVVL